MSPIPYALTCGSKKNCRASGSLGSPEKIRRKFHAHTLALAAAQQHSAVGTPSLLSSALCGSLSLCLCWWLTTSLHQLGHRTTCVQPRNWFISLAQNHTHTEAQMEMHMVPPHMTTAPAPDAGGVPAYSSRKRLGHAATYIHTILKRIRMASGPPWAGMRMLGIPLCTSMA